MRWTEEQLREYQSKKPLSAGAVKERTAKTKYRNKKTTWQGLQFDSIKELEDYKAFKFQEAEGAIRAVVRQVSFPLQGSTRRIRVDFMIVENDGKIRFLDSKGFATSEWLGKQKQVQEQYGIVIATI